MGEARVGYPSGTKRNTKSAHSAIFFSYLGEANSVSVHDHLDKDEIQESGTGRSLVVRESAGAAQRHLHRTTAARIAAAVEI